MIGDLRGELTVLALGATMWVLGAVAPGEWGNAFTGGGIVFTLSGLALIAVGLIRKGVRERLTHDRRSRP
jgi:hypothetical protein